MKSAIKLLIPALSALLLFAGNKTMDEGMWLLDSINKLPLAEMKKHGLELTPEQIYSVNGPSIKDAIVLLGGGTSSFISPDGLMLTNHHVAFAGIQAASSVQDDYLQNGFWAKSRSEELSTTYTAQILIAMKDVTADVLSAVSDTMGAEQRTKAIQAKSQALEKEAKGTSDYTCRVSELFNGLKYYLFTYESLSDVRLVYAPPSSIGNFGGEIDNWMWPRHTGDFSLMRAYTGPDGKPAKYAKENIPFKPKAFLPLSTRGFSEGSFAMVMGFPGRTFRYREAVAVEAARDETLPTTIDLYKTRIDIIDNAGKTDRAVQIKYASRVRGLANTYKNYLGTLEGMRRSNLLAMKRNHEAAFAGYLKSSPELTKKYGSLLADMDRATADLRSFNRKSILLTNLRTGIDGLRLAERFRTFASVPRTDSAGNTIPPTEKEQTTLKEFIHSTFKNSDASVDKQTCVALMLKALDMPAGQQIEALRDVAGNATGAEREQKVKEYVKELYEESPIATEAGCEKLMQKDPETILADPFVKLAAGIEREQTIVQARNTKFNATIGQLRVKFVEAWLGWKKGENLYPDANRTMRLTYGQVKSYGPRDAVLYKYSTTLSGVIEKEGPEDPFVVPKKLKDLWEKKDFGRYADAQSGDVPVAFLADLDITGGNSGSPVINGKGEVIGCAFDGNWEAVVGDYYFQEQYNRTIAVDARYVLFVLDKYSGAQNILNELTIR